MPAGQLEGGLCPRSKPTPQPNGKRTGQPQYGQECLSNTWLAFSEHAYLK